MRRSLLLSSLVAFACGSSSSTSANTNGPDGSGFPADDPAASNLAALSTPLAQNI